MRRMIVAMGLVLVLPLAAMAQKGSSALQLNSVELSPDRTSFIYETSRTAMGQNVPGSLVCGVKKMPDGKIVSDPDLNWKAEIHPMFPGGSKTFEENGKIIRIIMPPDPKSDVRIVAVYDRHTGQGQGRLCHSNGKEITSCDAEVSTGAELEDYLKVSPQDIFKEMTDAATVCANQVPKTVAGTPAVSTPGQPGLDQVAPSGAEARGRFKKTFSDLLFKMGFGAR